MTATRRAPAGDTLLPRSKVEESSAVARIREEQAAFEAQLDDLMKEHAGQFVLFKDGAPKDFFQAFEQAYQAGLDRFGVGVPFLVSEVKKRASVVPSISWVTGAMFGQS
jgi:hypothetical protein